MAEEKKKTIHSSFWANIFNPPTESDDLVKTLRSIPIFTSLTKRDFSTFISIFHSRNYLAGEYIFYQGDPGIGLYILREGEVEIIRENEKGDKLTLAAIHKGDFFGELALIDGEKRSASAVAKNDTRLSVIFKPDLDEYIEKYPEKELKYCRELPKLLQ